MHIRLLMATSGLIIALESAPDATGWAYYIVGSKTIAMIGHF